MPNRAEKIVGAEPQAANRIDFVDKDDELTLHPWQDDVAQRVEKAMYRPMLRMDCPGGLQFSLDLELIPQACEEPVIPLLRRPIHPHRHQIESGHVHPRMAQTVGRPRHKR